MNFDWSYCLFIVLLQHESDANRPIYCANLINISNNPNYLQKKFSNKSLKQRTQLVMAPNNSSNCEKRTLANR